MSSSDRWVARLTPIGANDVAALLRCPLGLDVWQRDACALIVAATDMQLDEVERRLLARVERIETVLEYVKRSEK